MSNNGFQKFYHKDLQKVYKNFNGIILDNVIGDISDIQNYLEGVRKQISPKNKILISYHNASWEPIFTIASKLGLRKKVDTQNWLNEEDIINLLNLSSFEVISTQRRFFGISAITIARTKNQITRSKNKEYSVSIIIPARNEEGNIPNIVSSIPKFGKKQEIIFVEGGSVDHTWKAINKQINKYANNDAKHDKKIKIRAFKQKGKGKANAVKLGLSKATGDILMIYDADRTVDAKDLKKFYNVLASGLGEFANGCRLIYPIEKDAMQSLNKIGNQVFSLLFTRILGQRFKDTLCGTKAFWKKDYVKFKHTKTDPFGDFDLIFGAIRNNLKVIEIPIRYKGRVYGSTNINRFHHGLLLAKMVWFAFWEFKT